MDGFARHGLAVLCAAALAAASCSVDDVRVLREGDLLFQVGGGSDFVRAIEDVTTAPGAELSFSHVGVLHFGDEGPMVVEATPEGGVALARLEDFLRECAHGPKGEPLLALGRYPDAVLAEKAAARSLGHLGKGYDRAFSPGDSLLYCSELVFVSFLDDALRPVFHEAPMTFRDSTGTTSPLWTEYYARLGEPVPEGVPGTNPNDLYREPALVRVAVPSRVWRRLEKGGRR